MSATMARQGGQLQIEQSHMHLALNMAKMAKKGFLHTAIEETKYQIMEPSAEVREEKMRGVESPGHKEVKTAIDRPPAMLRQNHTYGSLPWQNGTTNNPHIQWTRKHTGAPLANLHSQPATEPRQSLPGTPPTLNGNNPGL